MAKTDGTVDGPLGPQIDMYMAAFSDMVDSSKDAPVKMMDHMIGVSEEMEGAREQSTIDRLAFGEEDTGPYGYLLDMIGGSRREEAGARGLHALEMEAGECGMGVDEYIEARLALDGVTGKEADAIVDKCIDELAEFHDIDPDLYAEKGNEQVRERMGEEFGRSGFAYDQESGGRTGFGDGQAVHEVTDWSDLEQGDVWMKPADMPSDRWERPGRDGPDAPMVPGGKIGAMPGAVPQPIGGWKLDDPLTHSDLPQVTGTKVPVFGGGIPAVVEPLVSGPFAHGDEMPHLGGGGMPHGLDPFELVRNGMATGMAAGGAVGMTLPGTQVAWDVGDMVSKMDGASGPGDGHESAADGLRDDLEITKSDGAEIRVADEAGGPSADGPQFFA